MKPHHNLQKEHNQIKLHETTSQLEGTLWFFFYNKNHVSIMEIKYFHVCPVDKTRWKSIIQVNLELSTAAASAWTDLGKDDHFQYLAMCILNTVNCIAWLLSWKGL